ncbi:serine/threonine-protein kinase ULK3 isoform X7 [Pipistrellus kuhlii]|uniref:serine/threonine-protein kinase ULK3 isoform X7 n=1 Tax=Pipistrellus kuhlii TaxID=59472 RepID=UPI00174F5310|nr:serine/threonine-protein kinase ULK3 isoform X7 [Pipistrellus kuhlii]
MARSSWGPPRLDGFILTERLGSGTYATVYKAYAKKDTREVVAIKCVAKKSLNKASVENLLTEIEILKGIRHPHIVQLKDFQWDSDNIYLIMEFCAGGDLSRFIHTRRILPEKVARVFMQQLASALQFLHQRNISHLDLKPQNILLSSLEKPHLKLADFGFSQHMSPWDEKHVLRGSPLYMAPEMVCQRQYDARVDLWSVGVILYEALFGQPPFASRSFTELEEKIRSNRVIELPLRPQLSPDCQDLLRRLLERDPGHRISFQDFFAHPWVDLEHMPSEESLARATTLVVQAVKKDQEGNAAAALSLYCKALDFFVPALHCPAEAGGLCPSAAQRWAQLLPGPQAPKLPEMRKQAAPLPLSLCPSFQRWLGTSHASWLLWKWLQLLWPRRRKLAESRTPWACTSTAWGSCCCCWQVQNLMARAEYLKEQIKMRESHWEAETLDKEGLSESVRSSCTLQ